jgi:hypothetical protein
MPPLMASKLIDVSRLGGGAHGGDDCHAAATADQ